MHPLTSLRRFAVSTRGRLTLIQVAVLTVGVAIAAVAVYITLSVAQRDESDGVLSEQARFIIAGLDDGDGKVTFRGGELPGETEGGVAVDAAVVVPDGPVLQTPAQPLSQSALSDVAQQARTAQAAVLVDLVNGNRVPRRVYAEPLALSHTPGAVLVISRSVRELVSTLERIALLLLALSLLVVVLGGLLAHWLAGRALQPVRTIAGLARSLSEQDLHRRVMVKVPDDELGELVATFNGMLARLEASFDSLRRFTADASHELRAPLTLMRTELDVALGKARTEAEYIRSLRTVQAEVEHLSRMAEQLLLLARADAGALSPAKETIDVADFVHEVAARWQKMASQRGVTLEVFAPESGTLAADPALTRQILDNLVANAIRHTPPSSRVLIRAARSSGAWIFEVADQGPGVPSEHRARLFTRFARTDEARSRESGGAGLGLALSAAIARAQGGELSLVDGPGWGAVFRLRLPPSP